MDRAASTSEAAISEIGRQLYDAAAGSRPQLFRSRGIRGALLSRALRDEELKRALFQFIDVLPQLEGAQAIAQHFRAYLEGRRLGGGWARLMALGTRPMMAWAVRLSVMRLAELFLVGEKRPALARVLRGLSRAGASATIDAVGEAVLTDGEAREYVARYEKLLAWQDAAGVVPHVSMKLSGLTPRFDPLDREGSHARVLERIAPLMASITARGADVTIDMEQHELKPLVLSAFRAVVEAHPNAEWQPGIALQAYLHETERDLLDPCRATQLAGAGFSRQGGNRRQLRAAHEAAF
jgi:RHH-type proline utilization regulon transcriptional repressor/proline dehydrogenase/delta 1-pyrroline-5-carboxylate dehydrogenase